MGLCKFNTAKYSDSIKLLYSVTIIALSGIRHKVFAAENKAGLANF